MRAERRLIGAACCGYSCAGGCGSDCNLDMDLTFGKFANTFTNMTQLTHFDESGASRMVDVGAKAVTARRARAVGTVRMLPETLRTILDQKIAKGNVFEVARLAGIMAAKKTSELIPLCHSLGLDSVEVSFEVRGLHEVRIEATVSTQARTGVEMEAMTAVSIAALTIYDMCKAIDRGMSIGPIELLEKSGGKSGHYVRQG